MDWQIRIALIIVAVMVVGYIWYDFRVRQKKSVDSDPAIDNLSEFLQQRDAAGFDITGVSSPRSAVRNDDFPHPPNEPVLDEMDDGMPLVATREDYSPALKENPSPQTEQVLSLILRTTDGQVYMGETFLPLLLSQGLRHGDMQIFHRHGVNREGQSDILYSVANAIQPGTFDIGNLQYLSTPALAFFMTIPGPTDVLAAYEMMVKTARFLQAELGGQILDETKSEYTSQTHQNRLEMLKVCIA